MTRRGCESALHYAEISEIAPLIRRGEVSPVELTRLMLDRIDRLDGNLGCYVKVLAEAALAKAEEAQREIAQGFYRGPLHGVPVAVKDMFDIRGVPVTVGGPPPGTVADHDATVVRRFAEAGAILIGTLVMAEGALSIHHPAYSHPRNPWAEDIWAGISSSGSGVATAAGLCYGSLGTDTGGSVRLPAAANGLTGLKPSWGRISRFGLAPQSPTRDHIGALTRSVADAAVLLQAIAGADPHDPTASTTPVPDYSASIKDGVDGLRIGVDRRFNTEGTDAETIAALDGALETLSRLGADIREVQFQPPSAFLSDWSALSVEVALSYADRDSERLEELGPLLRSLIDRGRATTGMEVMKVQYARLAFTETLRGLFDQVDLLVTPVHPFGAISAEEGARLWSDAATVAQFVRYTMPFSYSGTPALALPCGADSRGNPLGMQFAAPSFAEPLLLRAGQAYQDASHWHRRRPPV